MLMAGVASMLTPLPVGFKFLGFLLGFSTM